MVDDIQNNQPPVDPNVIQYPQVQSPAASSPTTGAMAAVSPEGELVQLDPDKYAQAIHHGFQPATPEMIQNAQNEAKYGSLGEGAKAGAEGALRGLVSRPIASALEQSVGVKPEDIRGRQEANPGISGTAELAGLVAPAILSGGATAEARAGVEGAVGAADLASTLGKFSLTGGLDLAGETAAKAIGGTGIASDIGRTALSNAAQMALYQGLDETGRMIEQDPDQTVGTALAHVGMSGLLGGAGGAFFGSINPLFKAVSGNKVGQILEDFKGRLNEHISNPDPIANAVEEFGNYYKGIKEAADDVYGAQGLKAKGITASMPELNQKILGQTQEISDKVKETLTDMMQKPDSYPGRLVSKLNSDLDAFQNAVSDPNRNSSSIFNATQDLKQTLQGYSKFDKFVKPVDEAYDFVKASKQLSYDLRTRLEDPAVWGKAADLQQGINGAFKKYLPTLQDFEKKFTSEVAGERIIDPGKVSTYMNQLGKSSAEIKQAMVKNFIDASESYKNVINDLYSKLGAESPIQPTSTQGIMNTLRKPSTGAKLADLFVKKGAEKAGGEVLGAGFGASLGHLVGAPGFGALIGQHALGPFFSSVLPALAKPFLKEAGHAEGAKAAVDYAMSAAKGEMTLSEAAKNVFKSGADVLAAHAQPSERDTDKLNERLEALRADPNQFMQVGNHLQKYLPEHAAAAAATAANASNYLNSLRPSTGKNAPLDANRKPSSAETAAYKNALAIAQNPLITLKKAKEGTLTPQDVKTFATVNPGLYKRTVMKLSDELIKHVNKGESVPYKTRLGLSMLMQQPLDSTMTGQSIIAAQPTPQQGPQPQQGQAKGSKSSLSKSSLQYQTEDQAAEQRRLKR